MPNEDEDEQDVKMHHAGGEYRVGSTMRREGERAGEGTREGEERKSIGGLTMRKRIQLSIPQQKRKSISGTWPIWNHSAKSVVSVS